MKACVRYFLAMVDGYSNGVGNGWSNTPVTGNCVFDDVAAGSDANYTLHMMIFYVND